MKIMKISRLIAYSLLAASAAVAQNMPADYDSVLKTLDKKGDFKDGFFTVFLNGERLFETEDRTFTKAGKTGLWTKADSITYFDEFTVIGK